MKPFFSTLLLSILAFSLALPQSFAQNDTQKARDGLSAPHPETYSTQPVLPNLSEDPQAITTNAVIRDLTPENIFDALVDPIYLALVTLLGYLSAFIPGFNKINNTWLRVFSVALVIGLGLFLWHGNFWRIAVTYVISSGLYVTIFRNIIKTPKPSTT